MRLGKTGCLGILCWLVIVSPQAGRASEPGAGVKKDQLAAELIELGEECDRMDDEWIRSVPSDGPEESDADISDEEWLKVERERQARFPSPDLQLLPRFLALAEKHPDSPLALDALTFVIRRGGQTIDVHNEAWRAKERAIDLMLEHNMDDPRVVHVLEVLSGSMLPSAKTESFLRTTMKEAPDRATRAAAHLRLARYLQNIDRLRKLCERLKNKQRLLNYERSMKIIIPPYLEQNFPYEHEEVSAEVKRLLTRITEEYRDVEAVDWKLVGPSKVFLQSDPDAEPRTYGEMAESMSFAINRIVPGKKAPEIEGIDAEGNRFHLSDYEGRVILLTFSANWCGPCVKLYPLQRNLVEKFQDEPFVLLSVSMDEGVDTLKASLTSGDIRWRCWWDGLDGPIYTAWNFAAGSIFLLDHNRIIQEVRLNRATPQEDFERAISLLLSKIPTRASDR